MGASRGCTSGSGSNSCSFSNSSSVLSFLNADRMGAVRSCSSFFLRLLSIRCAATLWCRVTMKTSKSAQTIFRFINISGWFTASLCCTASQANNFFPAASYGLGCIACVHDQFRVFHNVVDIVAAMIRGNDDTIFL